MTRSDEIAMLLVDQTLDEYNLRQDLPVECCSYEDAGLEERQKQTTSVPQLVGYLFDGEDSRYENN